MMAVALVQSARHIQCDRFYTIERYSLNFKAGSIWLVGRTIRSHVCYITSSNRVTLYHA